MFTAVPSAVYPSVQGITRIGLVFGTSLSCCFEFELSAPKFTLNVKSPWCCEHNTDVGVALQVIYQLKKRCGDLSEEELGKLSVQLLNCQSEVEERPIFTCTTDMVMTFTIFGHWLGIILTCTAWVPSQVHLVIGIKYFCVIYDTKQP